MSKASQIEALYSCGIPSKTPCDLFVMLGTSLMDGYSTSYATLDSDVVNYYLPTGDQTHCERYGTTQANYETPLLNKGQMVYMNRAYNYQASSSRFGIDSFMSKELYYSYNWDRACFYFHYEYNGASIISGETSPSWNVSDNSLIPLMLADLVQCYNILVSRGYSIRMSVIWGSAAATNTTDTDYRDSIQAIITSIRNAINDSTVNFIFGKPVSRTAANNAFRSGIELVKLLDARVDSFDYNDIQLGGDLVHPTTMAMIDLGFILAGYWNEKYNSNTRPSVSSVQVTGTLKSGQNIGFTYTYSDTDSENTSVVADTFRFRNGTGTRCEFYVADDAVGTNEDYMNAVRNVGETLAISVVYVGKYVQARIFPKSLTGSKHGYPVKGSWQGPIVA